MYENFNFINMIWKYHFKIIDIEVQIISILVQTVLASLVDISFYYTSIKGAICF